jgi:hypothetical protein
MMTASDREAAEGALALADPPGGHLPGEVALQCDEGGKRQHDARH